MTRSQLADICKFQEMRFDANGVQLAPNKIPVHRKRWDGNKKKYVG